MTESKINILPEFITNKIAAGEVVQRPESVVKELLENAIDANAQNVELYIKDAGKSLIMVADDGDGMTADDAKKSVLRHATSKIKDYDDLERIATYGFRGEALSSIAAVSILEIKTERREDDLGTLIRVEDGTSIIEESGSFSKGTSVSVKNLFFNTPARRNFLKTNATELKHVTDTFKRAALSYKELGFKMYNDGELVYDLPPASLDDRIAALFSENTIDALVEVEELTDYVNVTGYVSKPTFLRKNKGDQYLFINKRPVSSKTINHAVFTAYENILEKGEYPFFVLFLDLDPAKVDINIHPSKLEVKFDDDNGIYAVVNAVVKKTLGSYDLVPSMSFNRPIEDREKLLFNSYNRVEKNDFGDRPSNSSSQVSSQPREIRTYSDDEIDQLFDNMNTDIKRNAPAEPVSHPFETAREAEYHSAGGVSATKGNDDSDDDMENASFIVLLHKKYILTQIKTGLMIIDHHVAHERILYEEALAAFEADLPFSQQLLFSQQIKLDPGEFELLKELYGHIHKLGFEIKFLTRNNVLIEGVPSDVNVGDEAETLRGILDEYRKNMVEKQLEVRDNLAKSWSCKAAVKAGDKLTVPEMKMLIERLFATSMPYVCPHGRPIVIKIPLVEFDRRFGRT